MLNHSNVTQYHLTGRLSIVLKVDLIRVYFFTETGVRKKEMTSTFAMNSRLKKLMSLFELSKKLLARYKQQGHR